jgi:predicted ribonuclease YlaK
MEEPDISFSGHGLRSDKPDDNLIASVLSLDPETRETAVLITGDTGPRIKAGRLDLQCMSLPEEYKAESALSEVEKENRRLQKKIDRLENRLPELDLVFKGGEKHCEFQVSEYDPLTEEEIDTKVEEIREQYRRRSTSRYKSRRTLRRSARH